LIQGAEAFIFQAFGWGSGVMLAHHPAEQERKMMKKLGFDIVFSTMHANNQKFFILFNK